MQEYACRNRHLGSGWRVSAQQPQCRPGAKKEEKKIKIGARPSIRIREGKRKIHVCERVKKGETENVFGQKTGGGLCSVRVWEGGYVARLPDLLAWWSRNEKSKKRSRELDGWAMGKQQVFGRVVRLGLIVLGGRVLGGGAASEAITEHQSGDGRGQKQAGRHTSDRALYAPPRRISCNKAGRCKTTRERSMRERERAWEHCGRGHRAPRGGDP